MKGLKSVKEEKLKKTAKVCKTRGCTASISTRAKWCDKHREEVRKEQLRVNNIAWKKRVDAGKAGHRVAYKGKPTPWALGHKKQALAVLKSVTSKYGAQDVKRMLSSAQ